MMSLSSLEQQKIDTLHRRIQLFKHHGYRTVQTLQCPFVCFSFRFIHLRTILLEAEVQITAKSQEMQLLNLLKE